MSDIDIKVNDIVNLTLKMLKNIYWSDWTEVHRCSVAQLMADPEGVDPDSTLEENKKPDPEPTVK